MRLNWASAFRRTVGLSIWVIANSAGAADSSMLTYSTMPGAYRILSEKAAKIEDIDNTEGWSFVVSGAAALAVSTPAYYLTEDTFARAVYSLGQTLGVGSIGYGSYLVMMKNDYTVFQQIVGNTRDLSPAARDELSYRFLLANAAKARSVRKIRTITHGLTAALNISSAVTSDSRELSTALYFVGGINVLAALNFAFRRSEEEKFLDQFAARGRQAKYRVEPVIGPVTGVKVSF